MIWTLVKAIISAAVIVAVAEVSGRIPRLGALLLTLPIVSILAFIMTWTKEGEMTTISQLARETLVLVPLGLPFFIPFALANRTGLSFWPTFAVGVLLASITIGLWFRFGPSPPASPNRDALENKDGNERTCRGQQRGRESFSAKGSSIRTSISRKRLPTPSR